MQLKILSCMRDTILLAPESLAAPCNLILPPFIRHTKFALSTSSAPLHRCITSPSSDFTSLLKPTGSNPHLLSLLMLIRCASFKPDRLSKTNRCDILLIARITDFVKGERGRCMLQSNKASDGELNISNTEQWEKEELHLTRDRTFDSACAEGVTTCCLH